MIFYLILFTFMTILYVYSVYKSRNVVNLVFYKYLGLGITMILPYCFRLVLEEQIYSVEYGDILLLFYLFCTYVITFNVEISDKRGILKLPAFRRRNYPTNFIMIILVIIFLIYWGLNISILKQAIINPRMFYAESRIGGGTIYYIILPIAMILYMYFISKIDFSKNYMIIRALLYTILFFAIFYIFGQKSKIVMLSIIFLSTYMYKREQRDVNRKIIKYGLILIVAILLVFSMYFSQQNMNFSNVFMGLVSYSDYLSNFKDLVKNLDSFYYGRIFFEDEFLSYIPRAIWKGKPELFGSLILGLKVPRLYEWTMAKTGAPSFGPIGSMYADFGILGIGIQLIIDYSFIKIARYYEILLSKDKYNFFWHLMVLTFTGYAIFSITQVKFPIYQLIVIFAIYKLGKLKLVIRKKEG